MGCPAPVEERGTGAESASSHVSRYRGGQRKGGGPVERDADVLAEEGGPAVHLGGAGEGPEVCDSGLRGRGPSH